MKKRNRNLEAREVGERGRPTTRRASGSAWIPRTPARPHGPSAPGSVPIPIPIPRGPVARLSTAQERETATGRPHSNLSSRQSRPEPCFARFVEERGGQRAFPLHVWLSASFYAHGLTLQPSAHEPFSVEAAAEDSSPQRWTGQAWACVSFSVTIWGELKRHVRELCTRTLLLAVLRRVDATTGPQAAHTKPAAWREPAVRLRGGAVGKNPQTGRRDGKTRPARRGLPFSGYFLHPPLSHGFVTGTGHVRWLRDPPRGTGHCEAGTRRTSGEPRHRLHVAGSGPRPLPRAGQGSASVGERRDAGARKGPASPSAPVSGCRSACVRPFPGGAGLGGEPEIASSSPPLSSS